MDAQRANEELLGFTVQYLVSQAFFSAARLKIADHLADGPLPVEELATRCKLEPVRLYRMMRLLAGHGLFHERSGRRFALNELAEYLRGDVVHSYLDCALMLARNYGASTRFHAGLAQDEALFSLHTGKPLHEFAAEHPDFGAAFERAMDSLHGVEVGALRDVLELSEGQVFADIGGGNGDVLVQVLNDHATVSGVLFDKPAVVARTLATLKAFGLERRCHCVAGDFFDEVPVSADVYFLRHILHDCTDDECLTVLRRLADAAPAGARLIVAECLVEPPNVTGPGKHMDMVKMQFSRGHERSAEEFDRLFDAAGWVFSCVLPTASMISLIEARLREL
jgi:precorrin-6B methylase 2